MSTDSLPRLAGIYLITCTANGKVYVGSSVNIAKRIYNHFNQLRNNRHDNIYLQRAFNKYGEGAFDVTVLELCISSRLLECEGMWFKHYFVGDMSKCFNVATVPYSVLGIKRSDETRAKLSALRKGKKLASDQIEKLKTRLISDDTRAKRSMAMKGRKPSQKAIENQFQKMAKRYIITSPDGTIFEVIGLNKFCAGHGLDTSMMSKVARGIKPQHKGWTCRLIN